MTAKDWAELAEMAKASTFNVARDGRTITTVFDSTSFIQALEQKSLSLVLDKQPVAMLDATASE